MSRYLGLTFSLFCASLAGACSVENEVDASKEKENTTTNYYGSPCDFDDTCPEGVCVLGYCRRPCGTDADCPLTGVCVSDGTSTGCRTEGEVDCSASDPCGAGLVCAPDRSCRVPCDSARPCEVAGQSCAQGSCITPFGTDAGPPDGSAESGPDAVVEDGGGDDAGEASADSSADVQVEAGCKDNADCDDGIGCTTDNCNPAFGTCYHTPKDFVCNDGNACNGVETCDAKSGCTSGVALDCDDDDPCTKDGCVPQGGCKHEPADFDGDGFGPLECPGGTDCDDNDFDVNPGLADIPCNQLDDDCDGSDSGTWRSEVAVPVADTQCARAGAGIAGGDGFAWFAALWLDTPGCASGTPHAARARIGDETLSFSAPSVDIGLADWGNLAPAAREVAGQSLVVGRPADGSVGLRVVVLSGGWQPVAKSVLVNSEPADFVCAPFPGSQEVVLLWIHDDVLKLQRLSSSTLAPSSPVVELSHPAIAGPELQIACPLYAGSPVSVLATSWTDAQKTRRKAAVITFPSSIDASTMTELDAIVLESDSPDTTLRAQGLLLGDPLNQAYLYGSGAVTRWEVNPYTGEASKAGSVSAGVASASEHRVVATEAGGGGLSLDAGAAGLRATFLDRKGRPLPSPLAVPAVGGGSAHPVGGQYIDYERGYAIQWTEPSSTAGSVDVYASAIRCQ